MNKLTLFIVLLLGSNAYAEQSVRVKPCEGDPPHPQLCRCLLSGEWECSPDPCEAAPTSDECCKFDPSQCVTEPPPPPVCEVKDYAGDFNRDGSVNLSDLNILRRAFLRQECFDNQRWVTKRSYITAPDQPNPLTVASPGPTLAGIVCPHPHSFFLYDRVGNSDPRNFLTDGIGADKAWDYLPVDRVPVEIVLCVPAEPVECPTTNCITDINNNGSINLLDLIEMRRTFLTDPGDPLNTGWSVKESYISFIDSTFTPNGVQMKLDIDYKTGNHFAGEKCPGYQSFFLYGNGEALLSQGAEWSGAIAAVRDQLPAEGEVYPTRDTFTTNLVFCQPE